MSELIYGEEIHKIIGLFSEVWNTLGYGFREIVYKDALAEEFSREGVPFIKEDYFLVCYKGTFLKHTFRPDFTVHKQIIIEVKANDDFLEKGRIQLQNYLRASGLRIGLIVNFGKINMEYEQVNM